MGISGFGPDMPLFPWQVESSAICPKQVFSIKILTLLTFFYHLVRSSFVITIRYHNTREDLAQRVQPPLGEEL